MMSWGPQPQEPRSPGCCVVGHLPSFPWLTLGPRVREGGKPTTAQRTAPLQPHTRNLTNTTTLSPQSQGFLLCVTISRMQRAPGEVQGLRLCGCQDPVLSGFGRKDAAAQLAAAKGRGAFRAIFTESRF